MNKLSILINSCDNYSDTWDPFFFLINKFWRDNKYPVFLNTESKQYHNSNLDIKVINQLDLNKKIEWSQRLIDALNRIDSEYVLMMLDDFFIYDYVNASKIEQCILNLDNDKNIACFYLYHLPFSNTSDRFADFDIRDQDCQYKLNCQIGIWRRELLISFLRGHENPWQFETLGSKRAKRYNYDFYSLNESVKLYIPYDFHKYGLIRGKWFPDTELLFVENNISVDYSIRSFYESNQIQHKKTLLEVIAPKNVLNYFKYIINKAITEHKSLR